MTKINGRENIGQKAITAGSIPNTVVLNYKKAIFVSVDLKSLDKLPITHHECDIMGFRLVKKRILLQATVGCEKLMLADSF